MRILSFTCALPAPDSIPRSKYPDGNENSSFVCDSCNGGLRAVPNTLLLGVATCTPIVDGTGVSRSEIVQFVLEGTGVGGHNEGGGDGAIMLLMMTGMTKSYAATWEMKTIIGMGYLQ